MRTHSSKSSLLRSGLAASVLLLANAAFAQVVNLTAAPTQAVLPDGQSIPMWGYTCGAVTQGSTPGTSCAPANAAAGANWSPVVITVPYTESAPGVSTTSLTINLVNNLSFQPPAVGGTTPPPNNIPTSIVIDGQLGGGLGSAATFTASPDHSTAQTITWPAADPTPTGTPPAQLPRVQSFATEVAATPTTTVQTPTALLWSKLRPGTYLIHSGTHPSIQHPMGLYGVLVVTAAPADNTSTGTAYPGVTYNADVALLLGEIDPVQNLAVNAAVRTAGFSETKVWSGMPGMCGDLSATATAEANTCYPPAVNYDPRYFLINGTSFDMSNPMGSLYGASPADTTSGSVLVRLVNAGLRMHVPSIVGSLTGAGRFIGTALGARKETFLVLNASDVLVGGAYLLFLLTVAQRLLHLLLPRFQAQGEAEAAPESGRFHLPKAVLATLLALSLVLVALIFKPWIASTLVTLSLLPLILATR